MELYRRVVRPLLFRLDAETSHRAAIALCKTLGSSTPVLGALQRHFDVQDPRLRTTVAGIAFPGPVGLAAGFDKNAEAVDVTSRLGFGFVEVGSVSEQPSPGNAAKPRLWRLTADEALRVYYGCPSEGAGAVAARLQTCRAATPLGVNLVETNTGSLASAAHAAEEIVRALRRCAALADYVVLNLSCPNMPQGGCGLFDDPAALCGLLTVCGRLGALPPVFLKLTPPGDAADPRIIDTILQAVDPFSFVKGFVLNIPNRAPHETLRTPAAELARSRGGITGPSLRAPTNAAIRAWYTRMDRTRHVLVGVGGIGCAEDAYETIRLGASLVQLYTAMVYRGPGLIKRINDGLSRLLARDGLHCVADAVGIDNPSGARRRASFMTAAER